ncbi:MAG: redoxin domain-containing protein [Chloroflexota bacterium]|nr:redoxin domain-containing protein [Chloroflexota bacterium]
MGIRPAGLQPGASIDLTRFVPEAHAGQGGRTLLFFERGHWCAECVRHLQDLAAAEANLRRFADRIMIVTHEPVAHAQRGSYPFPIVPDPDLELTGPLDLVHFDEFGKRTIRPSSLLLDERGIVLFSYVGDDSRDRPTVAALLHGLESLDLF